jgi:hypothetical protein
MPPVLFNVAIQFYCNHWVVSGEQSSVLDRHQTLVACATVHRNITYKYYGWQARELLERIDPAISCSSLTHTHPCKNDKQIIVLKIQ